MFVNEKPTNALIIQCIGTQYSLTCFGTLKYHNQGVKHDPAQIRAVFSVASTFIYYPSWKKHKQ
jgi:hypothetical protein